jgi:transcriptional regulator with XRE-family HTH domain
MDTARRMLAERLRDAREHRGLSQEAVARQLGLPRPAISHIENGHRRVEALELTELARIYDRPLSYFTTDAREAQLERLVRATAELAEADRDEVLRFAEELKRRRYGT